MDQQRFYEAVTKVEGLTDDIIEIKGSLRSMAEAIARLAVIEERQLHTNAAMGRAFTELDKHDVRIRTIEDAQPMQKQASDWVHKAVWLVVSAVIGAVVSMALVTRSVEVHKADVPLLTMPSK